MAKTKKQTTALVPRAEVRPPTAAAPPEMPFLRRARLLRRYAGPPGRPPKLTPEVTETVISALKVGAYLEVAAAFAGVDIPTLHRWLRKGQSARYKTIYSEFRAAILQASAQCDVKDLLTIDAATKEYWAAAAWRLERRHPEHWAIRGMDTPRPAIISITQQGPEAAKTTVVIDVGATDPRRGLPAQPPVMQEGRASSVIDVQAIDVTAPRGGNGNGHK